MEVDNMERETLSNRLRTAYWSLVALGCGADAVGEAGAGRDCPLPAKIDRKKVKKTE